MVKEMHYQENIILFELDPKVKGVMVTLNVAQYPRHHVTNAPARFDVAKEQMHLQENTLFDLDLLLMERKESNQTNFRNIGPLKRKFPPKMHK